jgi:hypothetical protein
MLLATWRHKNYWRDQPHVWYRLVQRTWYGQNSFFPTGSWYVRFTPKLVSYKFKGNPPFSLLLVYMLHLQTSHYHSSMQEGRGQTYAAAETKAEDSDKVIGALLNVEKLMRKKNTMLGSPKS